MKVVDKAMDIKDINIDGPTTILMIGGTSKMPIIKDALEEKFATNEDIRLVYPDFDPQLMVVQGAAFIGSSIAYYERHSNNYICPHSDIVSISNALPLALGFKICKGFDDKICDSIDVIVKKNENFPVNATETYCQHGETQTRATLTLLEGDSDSAKQNYILGTLDVKNIPPRGKYKCDTIQVFFSIDQDGIATVTAKINPKYLDDKTKKEKETVFETNIAVATKDGLLTQSQVEKQRKEVLQWIGDEETKVYITVLMDSVKNENENKK